MPKPKEEWEIYISGLIYRIENYPRSSKKHIKLEHEVIKTIHRLVQETHTNAIEECIEVVEDWNYSTDLDGLITRLKSKK